ncbi:DUF4241 domain-containing protein [Streptomyces sp. NPDC000594]|uniref:DUF4241 domain-containing protein n=1 Tax=Streptomyces sp. NPDC000594 TaxID=3154261 RepID=UPI003322805D
MGVDPTGGGLMDGERGPGTVVEVAYALGWDLEARAPWRPLTAGAARERDAAGLPYAVVHRIPGREIPLEVRLVSWRDHYAGLWVYDDRGRRTDELDLRLLDDPGRLLVRRRSEWRYTGPGMAEFDPACPRAATELFPDGKGSVAREPRGERGEKLFTRPGADVPRWRPRPGFGGWPVESAGRRGLAGPVVLRAAPDPGAADPSDGIPQGIPDQMPDEVFDEVSGAVPVTCWRPPRPARAGRLDALFRPGTRVTDGYHPEMTVVEPRRVGTLRVPSGVLAVSGPDRRPGGGPALTVPVPPGEHVLEEAQVRFGYDCEWSRAWVTRTDTTAVRLRVGGAPALSWEMCLGPDDDPRLLGADGIFGFDTDGATGCFADAGAWAPLHRLFERSLVQGEQEAGEAIPDSMYFLRTRDEATGGELVAFATTGDGTYPVWVGRSGDGAVAEVVVLVEGMPTILDDA